MTIKEIDLLVEDFVSQMFRNTNKILTESGKDSSVKPDTAPVQRAKRELGNAVQNFYNRNDKNKSFMHKWGKSLGVNTWDKGEARNEYTDSILNRNNGSYEKSVGEMGDDLKNVLTGVNKINNTNPSDAADIRKNLGGNPEIQRYKDIADKLGITSAYDQERAKEAGLNNAPFGTSYVVDKDGQTVLLPQKPQPTPAKYDKNGNLKRDRIEADPVVGYDFENLDLTNVSDKDITKYFKTGTRQDHHFNENPNNPTYGQLAEMAENGDEKALIDLKNLYFKAMFNKMLNSKFGYDFKMPTAMYTYGNSKLPNDTLVINFTTAHRCPAWKECLVGYACYARGSEHNYEGLHKKNSNLHLMWLAGYKDPKILESMFNVIRMHLINPDKMAGALLTNPETQQKWFKILSDKERDFSPINKATFNNIPHSKDQLLGEPNWNKKTKNDDFDNFDENKSLLGSALNEVIKSAKPLKQPKGAKANLAGLIFTNKFSELFDKKDLAVIKNTPNAFKAKFIRLNEEGDFIGQWLLNAFDKFAGELKLVGISTAAYTCRNLNFSNIKNIIINASTINVGTGGEKPGEVSNAIARRFFAVSSNLYNSLEDTYKPNGKNFKYVPPKGVKLDKKDYKGDKPIVPLHKTPDGLHVKYALKSFVNGEDTTNPATFVDRFDKNGPTEKNRLYYKCPCGRHGDVLDEKGKPIKMDCYLCRMCYEPKNQKTGEIYVLVEVHGENIDSFDMNKANAARGISNKMATYKEAKEIFSNRLCENHKIAEKMGLELVGKNIINSVKNHLSEIAENEYRGLQEENKKFSDTLKRLG